MRIDHTNWDDAKRYFQGTYIKCKETGERLLYVSGVDSEMMVLSPYGDSDEEFGLKLINGYDINFMLPGRAMFQGPTAAFLLSRIPQRMWQKGISNKNTQFTKLLATLGWRNAGFSPEMLENFVNKPVYFNFNEALNEFKLRGELESVALSSRVAMAKNGIIYIDYVNVGTYNKETNEVVLKKFFVPDIEELFPVKVRGI